MSNELKRVLYIEDDEDIAELTQMVLEEVGGFEVTYCDNGKAALEAFVARARSQAGSHQSRQVGLA